MLTPGPRRVVTLYALASSARIEPTSSRSSGSQLLAVVTAVGKQVAVSAFCMILVPPVCISFLRP